MIAGKGGAERLKPVELVEVMGAAKRKGEEGENRALSNRTPKVQ